MTYYIYMLLDPRKFFLPFYVGKGSGDRCKLHLSEDKVMNENRKKASTIKAIRKAGKEPAIFIWQDGIKNEDEAYALEASLIARFGRRGIDEDGILANICVDKRPPSGIGRVCSKETRKKIGDAQRGEKNHRYGKTPTDEHRSKTSQSVKASGNKPPVQYGPMSDEQKKKIGDGNRGKKRSEEVCKKLSEQRKGRKRKPHSPDTIEKIRQSNLGKKKRPRTDEEKKEISERVTKQWQSLDRRFKHSLPFYNRRNDIEDE